MQIFDDQDRGDPRWSDWENDPKYKFAVVHDGRRYPVKEIVSIATGAPKTSFSGGYEANHFVQSHDFSVIRLGDQPLIRYWWVNQGATYEAELHGEYIWAPMRDRGGRVQPHHASVADVQPGDILLHYAKRAIRAVGVAMGPPEERQRPVALPGRRGDDVGRFVPVHYSPAPDPIKLREIPGAVRSIAGSSGPFNQDGAIKQGYLYPLDPTFIEQLSEQFSIRLPGLLAQETSTVQNVWLFQSVPWVWDLSKALETAHVGDTEDWLVRRLGDHMQVGDPVVLWMGGSDAGIYALGEIASDIYERPVAPWRPNRDRTGDTEPCVDVRYTRILDRPILKDELVHDPRLQDLSVIRAPQGTNFRVTSRQWDAIKELAGDTVDTQLTPMSESETPYQVVRTLDWLEETTLWNRAELEEIVQALRTDGRQIILAGPPGTSKTWLAKHIAEFFTPNRPRSRRVVQFHPSYGYEEFVEGLRPIIRSGALTFEVRPGIIKEMAALAAEDDSFNVLIIDEMNRANLPRVFGELMYLLEYRAEPIDLQYSADFALPRNLLIIGTMNTADRSIRSIDVALRRRFEIFECPPDAAILERFYLQHGENSVPDLVAGFEQLNADLTRHLDRHHTIGHAFFMVDNMTQTYLRRVWRRKIGPLIDEYFFDQPDVAAEYAPSRYWQTA